MSSREGNEAAVRACRESVSHGNLDALDVDALDAIISPDYVLHDPASREEIRGVEGARELVRRYRNAFGGLRVAIEHQFAAGDYVATRFTARGTHEGEFLGAPPTGRDVTVSCIAISRCRDGMIVEEWEVSDTLGALRQIGALPEMVES